MSGERILVIDDGVDMRDFVVKYVLKPNGYQSLEARDGLDGFEKIVSGQPDLAILDLQMPRLDGIGLLRKLREENIEIPVVLMTFYGSEEIAIEVFRLGVRDYVIKPFTEDELLGAIERALTMTRLRRERDELTERLTGASRDFQRRVRELQGLYRVGKIVAGLPEAETLIARILEAAVFLSGAETAALLLLSEDGEQLIRRASRAGREVIFTNNVVDDPLVWRALQARQPVAGQPYTETVSRARVAQLCAPLVIGGMATGALSITAPAETASEHQLQLLGGLADYAAIGMEQARLIAALNDAENL